MNKLHKSFWKPHLPKVGSLISVYSNGFPQVETSGLCVEYAWGYGEVGANLMIDGKIVFYTAKQFAKMAKEFGRYDYEKVGIGL